MRKKKSVIKADVSAAAAATNNATDATASAEITAEQ